MSTVDHISSVTARLDAEWKHLATSTVAVEALAGWQRRTVRLAGFSDFEAIRATVHDRGNPQRADQILAALVELAAVSGHGDRLAAWLVLQLLKPGAVRLACQLATLVGDLATSQATVFSELALGIREYPWQRRPQRTAANLLLDCRQRILRSHQRHRGELPCGLSLDAHHPKPADHDLVDNRLAVRHLLWTAQRRGVLDTTEVRLLLAVYLHDIPVDELVPVLGRSRSTLFALRGAAERRLREAFTTSGPAPAAPTWPDKATVVAEYRAGRSATGIARRHRTSQQRVLDILHEAGIPLRPPVDVDALVAGYQAGEAATALARRYGISTYAVMRRLHAAGVATRTTTGASRRRRHPAGPQSEPTGITSTSSSTAAAGGDRSLIASHAEAAGTPTESRRW